MAQFGNSKEITECTGKNKAYKWIRTQLLEIEDQLKGSSQADSEQRRLLEKFTAIINIFEEVDKTLNEHKLQYKEKEIVLKGEIEKLHARLQLKELECQRIAAELSDVKHEFEWTKYLTKEKLVEMKKDLQNSFKCKDKASLINHLNFMIEKASTFLQSYANCKTEQELMEAIMQKNKKELSQFTLSQRERIVYNYMHQAERQENLVDVCLEDLLKIPSKRADRELSSEDIQSRIREIREIISSLGKPRDGEGRAEHEKFIRLCCCRSAVVGSGYNELCQSDEEDSDVILLSEMSELEESCLTAKEARNQRCGKEKAAAAKGSKESSNESPVEVKEKPKEISKLKVQQDIIDQRMKKIKRPELNINNVGQNVRNIFLVPHSNKLPNNSQAAQGNVRSNPSASPHYSDKSAVLQAKGTRNTNSVKIVQNNSKQFPYRSFMPRRTPCNGEHSANPLQRAVPELVISRSRRTLVEESRSSSVREKVRSNQPKVGLAGLKAGIEVRNVAGRKVSSGVSYKVAVSLIANSAQRVAKKAVAHTPHACKYGNAIFSVISPARKPMQDDNSRARHIYKKIV